MPENEELDPNEAPEVKTARRASVEKQTAEYLASGGTVTHCPPCTFSKTEYRMARLQYGKVSEEFTEPDGD